MRSVAFSPGCFIYRDPSETCAFIMMMLSLGCLSRSDVLVFLDSSFRDTPISVAVSSAVLRHLLSASKRFHFLSIAHEANRDIVSPMSIRTAALFSLLVRHSTFLTREISRSVTDRERICPRDCSELSNATFAADCHLDDSRTPYPSPSL